MTNGSKGIARIWSLVFGVALLWVTFQSVYASVILTDDAAFGTDSVIRDVTNSRDYLQLVHTDGLGFAAVSAELGVGGDFEGWAIATFSDLETLRASAGLTHGSADPAQVAAAEELRDWFCIRGLVSCVQLSSSHEVARGLITDQTLSPPSRDAYTFGRRFNVSPEEVDARISGFASESAGEAVYLVRGAVVPSPGSALLLVLGLAAFAWSRRTGKSR